MDLENNIKNEDSDILERIIALEHKNRELEEKIAILSRQITPNPYNNTYTPNPYNKNQSTEGYSPQTYTPNPYNNKQNTEGYNPQTYTPNPYNSQQGTQEAKQRSYTPNPYNNPQNTDVPKEKNRDLESALGRNVMGMLSCALIFISAVLFAFLVYPHLTTSLKLFVMYFFSTAVLAFGVFLHNRKPGTLSLTLSGCGCGLIFLSFFLTHIYFHLINAYLLYIILLAWAVPVFYFGRKTSLMFSIIGQIGVFISVIAGVMQINISAAQPDTGSAYEYMFLLFYFILCSLIYLIPNLEKKCAKNLSSMIFIYSGLMLLVLKNHNRLLLAPDSGTVLVPVIICNVLLTAYILFLAGILHYYTDKETGGDKVVHSLFVLLGTFFLMLLFHPFSDKYNNGILCFILLLVFFLMNELQGLKKTGSVIAFVTDIMILLVMIPLFDEEYYFLALITYTFILLAVGLLMTFADKLTYPALLADKVPILDILQDKSGHFRALLCLHLPWLTIFYFVNLPSFIFLCLTLLIFAGFFIMIKDAPETDVYRSILYPVFTVFTMLSVYIYDDYYDYNYTTAFSLFFCLAALTHILLFAFRYNYPSEKLTAGTWQTGEKKALPATTIIMYITRIFIMFYSMVLVHEVEDIIWKMLIILFSTAIFFLNARKILERKGSGSGIYLCLKTTILVLNIVSSFDASQYVYSILLLLLAISAVVLGFVLRYKSLRIYGLTLSLISVAKLILIDIQYNSTPLRAFSFFVCGVLCLVISILYQKLTKKYED